MQLGMWKGVERRFSISAPKMSVRPYVPWYLRWAITLPFILAAGWLVWWAYDSGLEFAGFHRGQAEQELAGLREQVVALKSENAKLASEAASFERQAQIERAANLETERQLQGISGENVRLQEDLRLFQNLTSTGVREGELSIQHLKLEHDTLPGEYRYRLLLVQGGQQRAKVFLGNLQLLVNVQHNGRRSVVVFPQVAALADDTTPGNGVSGIGISRNGVPDKGQEDAAYQLNFKYYQRIERSFRLPADVLVESVQVRIFERGSSEPKAKQSITLS